MKAPTSRVGAVRTALGVTAPAPLTSCRVMQFCVLRVPNAGNGRKRVLVADVSGGCGERAAALF